MTQNGLRPSDGIAVRMETVTFDKDARPIWIAEYYSLRNDQVLARQIYSAEALRHLISYLQRKLQVLELAAAEDKYTLPLPLDEESKKWLTQT